MNKTEMRGTESRRRILAFYAKHKDHRINVHGEAQKVMENLRQSHWWRNFELDQFVLATYDSFKTCLRSGSLQNVVTLCVTGHAGRGGELLFNKDDRGREMEMLGPDFVPPHIAKASRLVKKGVHDNGTIECVVLNMCYSRRLAVALRKLGVLVGACWFACLFLAL